MTKSIYKRNQKSPTNWPALIISAIAAGLLMGTVIDMAGLNPLRATEKTSLRLP